MAKNDFDKLYAGVAENPKSMIFYHNAKRGAKLTKGKAKFRVVFIEPHESLTEARQREIQIKKWRRDKKEMLIVRYQKGLPTKFKNKHLV